jgi:Flp pilus assembly protein TadG
MDMMLRKLNPRRKGVAALELAVLLPFLAFLFVIAVDWSRLFYCSLTVENCARNGAMYLSDPYNTTLSPYPTLTAAALADASNITPQPTVSSASGSDGGGSYVDCTVSYTFQTVTNFPGVPSSNPIVRTVRVYTAPRAPN